MSALMMAAWLFSAAEIFMTGSQPLSFAVSMQPGLSEHLSEAFAAEIMQVASEKEKSNTHTCCLRMTRMMRRECSREHTMCVLI